VHAALPRANPQLGFKRKYSSLTEALDDARPHIRRRMVRILSVAGLRVLSDAPLLLISHGAAKVVNHSFLRCGFVSMTPSAASPTTRDAFLLST
jgi:hypothetical protein